MLKRRWRNEISAKISILKLLFGRKRAQGRRERGRGRKETFLFCLDLQISSMAAPEWEPETKSHVSHRSGRNSGVWAMTTASQLLRWSEGRPGAGPRAGSPVREADVSADVLAPKLNAHLEILLLILEFFSLIFFLSVIKTDSLTN